MDTNNNEELTNQQQQQQQQTLISKLGAKASLLSTATYLIDKFRAEELEEQEEEKNKNNNLLENIETEVEVLKTETGSIEGPLDIGKAHYAKANLAELKAGNDEIGVKTSILSASAHYEYGLNNSVGLDASIVRAEGHLGPVKVGTGINLDCHASIGVNGIEASVLGTGFSVGPKMAIKTPFVDLSLNLV